MITYSDAQTLLSRSYAAKLIEDYLDRFDQIVYGKLDFSLLSTREEVFEHLIDVFEQDLRIGEQSPTAEFAQDKASLLVKAVIYKRLIDQGRNLEDNLALKGWEIKDIEPIMQHWT